MANKTNTKYGQITTLRSIRLGTAFVVIFGLSTIIYKAWRLFTPEILQQRFIIIICLLLLHVILLLAANRKTPSATYYRNILWVQILSFLLLGGYSIYSERGMASNAIILFIVPIIISGLQRSGKVIFATTTLAAVIYCSSAITYFRQYPSEGYKVELYGGLLFYCAVFYVVAALLWVLIKSRDW